MKNVVLNILEKTKYNWTDVAKKKRGTCPQILMGDLFLAILSTRSAHKAGEVLNISPQTFSRTIKGIFPGVTLIGKQSWAWYLLNLSDYKYCTICKQPILRSKFTKDKSQSDGLDTKCKACKYKDHKEYQQIYQQENKEVWRHYRARRKAAELQRTPSWADLEAIKDIYLNCPEGYEVDHIVPLQGNKVSGLHVEYNLQYLTKAENSSKGNSF